MRKDLKRIIINTGRYYYTNKGQRNGKGEDPENLPEKESIRRPHRLRASQGDRLAPLYRWIRSQVGRPWDKVFAEICEVNDDRTIDGWHLKQHTKYLVETKHDPRKRPFRSYRPFYVDPHGILRDRTDQEQAPWRWKQKRPEPDRAVINGQAYVKRKEIWYKQDIVITGKTLDGIDVIREYLTQVSQKDLAKLGLK